MPFLLDGKRLEGFIFNPVTNKFNISPIGPEELIIAPPGYLDQYKDCIGLYCINDSRASVTLSAPCTSGVYMLRTISPGETYTLQTALPG